MKPIASRLIFIATILLLTMGLFACHETTTTTPAQIPQAAAPVAEQVVPAALPQSQPADALPMSVPDGQTEAAMPKSGGGCGHEKTVYLTN